VVDAVTDNNAIIVDARTPAEYNGTSTDKPSEGHIPGAVNLPYTELLTSTNAFKTKAEIEKIVSAKGITPDKTVYLYCRTSVRAGVIFLALKNILGYNKIKVYDGAYAEWSYNYELEK
jgi:thiosulfate/3-mercaptopyruvate sulfurtransferase